MTSNVDDTTPRSTIPVQLSLLLFALLTTIVSLASCGGGGDNADVVPSDGQENPAALAGEAVLVCDQDCAERGQCGETLDRGFVVLLNREGPAVAADQHDLAIPVETTVTIQEQRNETLVEVATGAEIPLTFFRVLIPERNELGWVAGWCLSGVGG